MASKLEHALDLAARGFYVFPVYRINSRPRPISAWRNNSSNYAKSIQKWWERHPDANIGVDCYKSGLTCIDIDIKNEKKGQESFDTWEKEFGWGTTLTVRTPSGGFHLIYKANGYKNSVEKLAPGIDVRGDGGYFVGAGSTNTKGAPYTILLDRDPQPLPAWLEEKLLAAGKAQIVELRASRQTIIQNHPSDIQAAIDFLKEHPPAVENHGGNNATYITFCMLKERGLSFEKAVELASYHWNIKCEPPWDIDDLLKIAKSAYETAQNATGVKSPFAEFDIPPEETKEEPKTEQPLKEPAKPRFNPGFKPRDASLIKPRDWVFADMALAKQVSMLIAPPGVGKSTFTLAMAISKITNRNILDLDPRGRSPVAIFNNEDNIEEQERRIVAALTHYNVPKTDLYDDKESSLLFLNGRESAIKIAERLTDNRLKSKDMRPMIDYALQNSIRLMIVDPFAMSHPASENSNEEILRIGELYNHVAEEANCAVTLVHHTRKLNKAQSDGHSGNLDSARGASSLGGLVRIAHTLDVIGQKQAKTLGIPEDLRKKFILLEQAKANMSAPGLTQKFYERSGQWIGPSLEDGEAVGVLTPVNLSSIATESKSEAQQTLIHNMERLLCEGPMSIPDLARAIASHFTHESPDTTAKTIRRLFEETEVLTGFKGTLHATVQGRTRLITLKASDEYGYEPPDFLDII